VTLISVDILICEVAESHELVKNIKWAMQPANYHQLCMKF